jgi:hypothetical protein
MNPFISMQETENENEDLNLLKEYAWDFIHDCFIYNSDGTHKIVTENAALEVWIYKALKTERYRYDCYRHGELNIDSNFGVELEQYIGTNKNNAETATQIIARVKECLEINPYISSINSIDITEIKGDKLTLSINLTSIYGNLETETTV